MTAIAGIMGPVDERVARARLQVLMESMKARGSVTQSLLVNGTKATVAIACSSHPGEESIENPMDRTSLAMDGSLRTNLELEEIGGQIEETALSEAIAAGPPFACLSISKGKLLAGRDLLGQKPLYFGRDRSGAIGVASLLTGLRKVGISSPKPVKPGLLVSFSRARESIISDQTFSKPKEVNETEQEASKRLGDLLLQSLEDEIPQDTAIPFSGGIDSSLVAQTALKNDLHPQLITVAMRGQPEIDHARRVSKDLGLEVTTRELSTAEVLEAIPEVAETIESNDPTLVGISLPIYFACETAEEMGMKCILAGQLSDELFAGYGRFDKLALNNRVKAATSEVWKSVLKAATNDFEPGDKLAVSHRMELRCPFAFLPLVRYALGLPLSLKLRVEGGRVIRKYILRRLASEWKLPTYVVEKPKKAIQYSSGVQKVLLREAKRRNLTLGNLIKSLRQIS